MDVGAKLNFFGMAASPVLYNDLLIVNASIESGALIGLDKKTGKEIWRTKNIGASWGSPLLVETDDGKDTPSAVSASCQIGCGVAGQGCAASCSCSTRA